MRRSLEEPNSLRATAPIIASSFHDRVEFRPPHRARIARPSNGKCCAIAAYARRHEGPNFGREIGGGGFVVNAKGGFTASSGGRVILPLPRTVDSASVRAGI